MPLTNETLKVIRRAIRMAKEENFELWGFGLNPKTGEWCNYGCEGISRDDFANNTLNMVREFSTRHHVKIATEN